MPVVDGSNLAGWGQGQKALWLRDHFRGGNHKDYEASHAAAKIGFRGFVPKLRQVREGGRLLELGQAYGCFLDLAQAL